ncbi:transcription factor bHLH106-like [Pyrus ussuriensis x Pyrus communis]|uniref:Transcription factor bHLH106-like n=1 Tax=Pyrus ussuriensis x Pyrus communis TaxID=2448454 RepID=A0A5N5GCT8_9ROSA|nr:transcription factor bHLH106-like [Pyrus ussuriensis x Pyrus communis]
MQPGNHQSQELYRFLVQNGLISVNNDHQLSAMQSFCSSSSNNYSYYPLELSGVSTEHDASPQGRALAALKNHKEAEKRRRERINSHLDKLRGLLPCNSKTDKASLLAKVVQRVKELKQQTSEIAELETFPSETDEITVLSSNDYTNDGRIVFKASLCCEDRSDLLPDLIEILKSLHLKTIKAEIATLGGRIRNVFIVAADKDHTIESVNFLQNALKSLLERSNSSERSKRRRVLDRTLVL